MAFFCSAPGISDVQLTLFAAYNSTSGFAFANASGSSKVPTLMIFRPEKLSPSRHKVDPQSPQKLLVMVLPPSAVFAYCFGLPDVSLKPSSLTAMLVLYVLPVIFRQSVQWQRAWEEVSREEAITRCTCD